MTSTSFEPPISALTDTPTQAGPDVARTTPGSDVTSTLINLCGRQRMLSQRLMLHLVLGAQGDSAALAIARDALNLFSDCHAVLSRGKGILPAPWTAALRDAFFGLQGADAPLRAFMTMSREVLERIESGAGHSLDGQLSPELVALVTHSTTVLAHLNHLTHCYEAAAHDAARHQRQQLHDLIERIRDIARDARAASQDAQLSAADQHAVSTLDDVARGLTDISSQIAQLAETTRRMH